MNGRGEGIRKTYCQRKYIYTTEKATLMTRPNKKPSQPEWEPNNNSCIGILLCFIFSCASHLQNFHCTQMRRAAHTHTHTIIAGEYTKRRAQKMMVKKKMMKQQFHAATDLSRCFFLLFFIASELSLSFFFSRVSSFNPIDFPSMKKWLKSNHTV